MSEPESSSATPTGQEPSMIKGAKDPRIWLDMDQKALDDAYDQACWAPNREHVSKRRRLASERVIARIGQPQHVAYGPTEIEKLAIHKSDRSNAPIMIFIHGGAWRGGFAKDFAYMAEMYLAAGAHLIIPDFVSVQDSSGSLMTMADQVRHSVAWVYKNATSFGGDSNRLYLSGHSSGGHLGGVIVTTDWHKYFDLPADIIKGALLVSGMYDLKPVRLSKRSKYVNFDDATVEALSAQRHIDKIHMPLTLAHGTLESPEFQRQSRDFTAAVKAAGKPVELIVGEGFNHFEMQETMGNPFGLGGRAALSMMKLKVGEA